MTPKKIDKEKILSCLEMLLEKCRKVFSESMRKFTNSDFKASLLCRVQSANTRLRAFYNGGHKQRAICIGSLSGALVLLCFSCACFFSDNDEVSESNTMAEAVDVPAKREQAVQHKSEGSDGDRRVVENRAKAKPIKKEVAENASEEGQEFDYVSEAKQIISGVVLLNGGRQARLARIGEDIAYDPEREVSYATFLKGYYSIEDAFLPAFLSLAAKVAPSRYFSKEIMDEYLPRANHLVKYCARTGIEATATVKEKKLYVEHLRLAKQITDVFVALSWTMGQDDVQGYNDAKKAFAEYLQIHKAVASHDVDPKASEKYVAPPLDLDIDRAFEALTGKYGKVSWYFAIDWRASNPYGDEVKTLAQMYADGIARSNPNDIKDTSAWKDRKEMQYRARVKKGVFRGVPARKSFPVDSICGFKFYRPHQDNQDNIECPLYINMNGSLGCQGYFLKKPFRMFKYAEVAYAYCKGKGYDVELTEYFEALYYVRLDGVIPNDINYESALQELAKVKSIVGKRYKINTWKSNAARNAYGVGLHGGGWILLALYDIPEWDGRTVKDGSRIISLEICCGDREDMTEACDLQKARLQARLKMEAEKKKKKLNISADDGVDVL